MKKLLFYCFTEQFWDNIMKGVCSHLTRTASCSCWSFVWRAASSVNAVLSRNNCRHNRASSKPLSMAEELKTFKHTSLYVLTPSQLLPMSTKRKYQSISPLHHQNTMTHEPSQKAKLMVKWHKCGYNTNGKRCSNTHSSWEGKAKGQYKKGLLNCACVQNQLGALMIGPCTGSCPTCWGRTADRHNQPPTSLSNVITFKEI